MSFGISSHGYGYNQPAASNVLHAMFREQEWVPRRIVNSASRRELESELVMDRLLRECLTPKSRWE
jgi:hypothetical protein